MGQPLRLAGRVDRSPAPRPEPIIRDEELARLTNVNLLIMGADDVVARFVTSLWPSFSAPSVVRRRDEPLRLAPASQQAGTILVYDVHALTRLEQHALSRWISAGNGRTRVVSTTTQSLLPLLETGAFNDGLYYRLNVVTLDLTSRVAQ